MNRATSPTGWVRNPVMKSPGLDPIQASSYELGWTYNPMSGCKNHTPEGLCLGGLFPCYACKLANGRLKPLYLANPNVPPIITKEPLRLIQAGELQTRLLDPFYPRFWQSRIRRENFGACTGGAEPKGIFVCDMGDLFGQGIPEEWTRRVLNHIGMSWYREHRFYLLTKQAQNLINFSPFPENCWVGVTATSQQAFLDAIYALVHIKATVRYISFEPLLAEIPMTPEQLKASCNWLIIGACTGTKAEMTELVRKYPELMLMPFGNKWTAQPPISWLREIIEAADKAGVKVFLKDNLEPLWTLENRKEPFFKFSRVSPGATEVGKLRQEMPIEQ